MKYIEVKGTPYEIGKQLGEHFKEYLVQAITDYNEKIKIESVYKDVKGLEEKLKVQFNDGLQEIYGRADGAGIDRDATLLMFFPEIYRRIDGCTTVIVKNTDDKFLFSHNEDDVNYNPGNVAFVHYIFDSCEVYGYTTAFKLCGSSFGFNNNGLVFSSNYIYDTVIELNNISRYIMVNDVMKATSLEDAIERLRKIKVASAFSLNILDIHENKCVNVEKDIEEIYVTEITEKYARANHFIAKPNAYTTEVPKSSTFRDAKSKELVAPVDRATVTISDLKNILAYYTDDYFESIYKDPYKYPNSTLSVTVANFSYDGTKNKIEIHDYLDGADLAFDLNEIVK